jgi:hypothetical protein
VEQTLPPQLSAANGLENSSSVGSVAVPKTQGVKNVNKNQTLTEPSTVTGAKPDVKVDHAAVANKYFSNVDKAITDYHVIL